MCAEASVSQPDSAVPDESRSALQVSGQLQAGSALQAPAAAASSPAQASAATQQPGKTACQAAALTEPAKPVADMQALARRIGLANKAAARLPDPVVNMPPIPHSTALAPGRLHGLAPNQAVSSASAVSVAGKSSTAVPAEIQAIILKLVHFIKVGSPGLRAFSPPGCVW